MNANPNHQFVNCYRLSHFQLYCTATGALFKLHDGDTQENQRQPQDLFAGHFLDVLHMSWGRRKWGERKKLILHRIQALVEAVHGDQLRVSAHFADGLVLQHHDLVGVADGGEAVGDDDGGAALHQAFQGLLDEQLGLGIDRGGGFIQDQDGSVLEHGAGDGEALLLPAGELDAALADEGVVALRQVVDELVGIGGLGGRDHLGLGGIRAAEEQVLAHRAVEEEDILQDDADLPAQALEGVIVQVAAIQGDGAVGHVVEAGDQADQGGLAHAGGSDQGHHGFGGGLQADILQDADAGGVFEVDMAEDHVALDATGDGLGARDVLGLVRFGHQVGHPVGAGQGGLDGLPGAAEVPHGGIKTLEVEEESHQVRDRQRPLQGPAARRSRSRSGCPSEEVNSTKGWKVAISLRAPSWDLR